MSDRTVIHRIEVQLPADATPRGLVIVYTQPPEEGQQDPGLNASLRVWTSVDDDSVTVKAKRAVVAQAAKACAEQVIERLGH
jgi:hypothetical protein